MILEKNKNKTFPPQGFGSHQDLVRGIHSSPITCQKSQAFPPFPTRALRLAWNYSTHEAKPVQQPLHKASHHSVSNSLTQVHTHAANPSANPSVSSPPLRVCWFRHDSRASLHPLYIYSFVDASFLPCQAAGHAALLLIAPAGDGPPPGTCGRCRRQIAFAGEGKTGLEISFWGFFLWKASPVNNNNDILLSFLIKPSSFWLEEQWISCSEATSDQHCPPCHPDLFMSNWRFVHHGDCRLSVNNRVQTFCKANSHKKHIRQLRECESCNLFPASACIYSSSVSALLTSLVMIY